MNIAGVILAGGRSERMGDDDKSFVTLNNISLLEHVYRRALPQVCELIINTNSDDARFLSHGKTVVPDLKKNKSGPLLGLLAAMSFYSNTAISGSVRPTHLATFPVDTPLIPSNLIERLQQGLIEAQADIAIPTYNNQPHWVCGLWSLDLLGRLNSYIEADGRKVHEWTKQQNLTMVEFDDYATDPFLNINTREQLSEAEQIFLK